jgi:hypothetical protein
LKRGAAGQHIGRTVSGRCCPAARLLRLSVGREAVC